MWTLIPGVPIGCRSPRKRGPSLMPSHNHRPPDSLSRRRDVRQSPRSLSPSGDGFTWERAPRRFATTRSLPSVAPAASRRGISDQSVDPRPDLRPRLEVGPKRHEALSIALFTGANPLDQEQEDSPGASERNRRDRLPKKPLVRM